MSFSQNKMIKAQSIKQRKSTIERHCTTAKNFDHGDYFYPHLATECWACETPAARFAETITHAATNTLIQAPDW
jgi:hypothetical protein